MLILSSFVETLHGQDVSESTCNCKESQVQVKHGLFGARFGKAKKRRWRDIDRSRLEQRLPSGFIGECIDRNPALYLHDNVFIVTLEHEMTYRFKVRGPLGTTEGSPRGARQYWEMSEGALTGARINAKLAMPGGDWMIYGTDGFGRPDVRVQFVTDDGALILLHYTGLVERTAAFMAASETGGQSRWQDQYMRMSMIFDTGAEKYAWLNRSLFIAEGRLAGPLEIEYRIYRVA